MKRVLKLILLLLAAAALLTGAAWAAEDPVEDFARQLARFQTEITVPVREYDALMEETFTRYPELYFYFDGISYRSVPEGLSMSVSYCNTDISLEDCYVIHSRDQLMAAMGLTMADLETRMDYVIAPDCQISDTDLEEIFQQLETDYYMIKMGYFTYSGNRTYNEYGEITVTRGRLEFGLWDGLDAAEVAQWRDETEAAVMSAASTLFAQDMPDYQKELIIHDYLVDNNRYDTLYMNDSVNHLAYSALVEGKTVCQGYTEAARLLLKAAGVPVLSVTGDAGGAHSWNCVQIGGEWYMLDITWDDPAADNGSDLGIRQYDYFNVTSSQLAQDHTWEAGEYPDCASTEMSYDAVRAAVDADTGAYSDYSTDLVETQEKDREALLALLGDAEPAAMEAETEAGEAPEEEADADSPEDTSAEPGDTSGGPADTSAEPEEADADPTDPAADPEEEADPLDPGLLQRLGVVDTNDDTETRKETTKGFSVGKLVLILVILAIVVGAVILVIYLTMLRRVSAARGTRSIRRERKVLMMSDRRAGRVSRR